MKKIVGSPRKLTIYIAASWKHRHAVEMLTDLLRQRGHEVKSFVENNHGEDTKGMPFDEWCFSPDGDRSFEYDTKWASESSLVIYVGPSGKDAAAEVGIAWQAGVTVLGLRAKGEDFGLMRRLIEWHEDYRALLRSVDVYAGVKPVVETVRQMSASIPAKVRKEIDAFCEWGGYSSWRFDPDGELTMLSKKGEPCGWSEYWSGSTIAKRWKKLEESLRCVVEGEKR